jgi:hypothetical protein
MSKTSHESEPQPETAHEFFENYADYNRTLRTWLVTFGLGGPALFLIEPDLVASLQRGGSLRPIIFPFLIGCGLQVLVALINKCCSWYEYTSLYSKKPIPLPWRWLLEWFWIDIVADVATIVLFGTAIWIMLARLVV